MSLVILQQGLSLSKVATMELLDAGIDASTRRQIERIIDAEVDGVDILGYRNVRGVKSGGEYHFDNTDHRPNTFRPRHRCPAHNDCASVACG